MKIRISYSLLKLWERGDREKVVKYYFKTEELPTTRYQEEGKAWDKLIKESVIKENKLPEEFGGTKFKSKAEIPQKIVVPYNDKFDLVFVPDVLVAQEKLVIETKTGSASTSLDYSNDIQVPMYFLGYKLIGIPIEKGLIIHYDASLPLNEKNPDRSLIWNNDYQLNRAKEAIEKGGEEIYGYFSQQGLI